MSTNPIITALTPQDFKDQFYRGFIYIPVWNVGTTYNTSDQVFYDVNKKFYECLNNTVIGIVPTDTNDWKEIEDLGFILDRDITNAYNEACIVFNDELFSSDDSIILAFLYLSAHYLVKDINAGGTGSVGDNPVTSRSVGSISESYGISQRVLDNPTLSFFSTTHYGLKYLSMLSPRLIGGVFAVEGGTNA